MIELINLKKRFNDRWITKGVTLTIPNNEMTVIIGKSGEGKSILLKQIIGLIKPTSGQVIINGINITSISEHDMDNIFKQVGYVFQAAALLDSLTVFENIGLTLLEKGVKKDKVLKIVKEKLSLVNLSENTLYKYPSELSGGMQKRVGLARTLLTNPQVLLYDEPTTGLDPITSKIIFELMSNMQKKLNLTSVVISHDLDIFNYADKVALLADGEIKFFGEAKTIWNSQNPYIYQFIRGLPDGPLTS